jgi:glycosyltransferase involved in cell wall biosynthesis
MSERRLRLLFVIGHLVQSGAERFTYEVVKAIDRKRFDVEVLTKMRVRPSDYYHDKIEQLGVRIHHRLPILFNRIQRHARPFFLLTRPVLEWMHRTWARIVMNGLLDRYDVINAVQIENYQTLQPLLRNNDRVVIYIMGNNFQYTFDPFADCRRGRRYRFVINDPLQAQDYSSACPEGESFFFPLALDLSDRPDLSAYARTDRVEIGVFIRLSGDRPIHGIFEAFRELLQHREARLCVWGRGNPERYAADLKRLGIADRVSFEGHTADIAATIRERGLSMVWMTCNGVSLGYASIEIASLGIPMLFWNLSETPDREVAAASDGSMISFQRPAALGIAADRLLNDHEACQDVGHRLRRYIVGTYDIANHIESLQNFLAEVARSA